MKRILIAEDEVYVRFLYKEALSQDYETEEAEDGFEALEMIESEDYDLIILDINMPMITGLEVLKRLKDKGLNRKIVVISAYGKAKKKEALELGAIDYLEKPIDLDKLYETIKMWC